MADVRMSRMLAAALLLGVGMVGSGGAASAAAPVAQIAQASQPGPNLAPCEAGDDEAEEGERDAQTEDTAGAGGDVRGSDEEAEGEDGDAAEDATEDASGAEGDAAAEEAENGAEPADAAKPGELSEGRDLLPQAKVSVEQAVTVAQGEANGALGSVELEERDGTLVFEVTVGEQEVFVDATDASVVAVEQLQQVGEDDGDADCEDETEAKPGKLDDGQGLLPEAAISLDQAVQTAQAAAQGELGEVDLERIDGRLVFVVDIGDQDVVIDAASGDVVTMNAED